MRVKPEWKTRVIRICGTAAGNANGTAAFRNPAPTITKAVDDVPPDNTLFGASALKMTTRLLAGYFIIASLVGCVPGTAQAQAAGPQYGDIS